MTTTVGYARVSTFEQILDLQKDALNAAGCKKIFTDTASGSRSDRPGLEQALDYVREGDVLVVWRLDRLGRSLKYLIEIITTLGCSVDERPRFCLCVTDFASQITANSARSVNQCSAILKT
jgi:predicted site-specific integrase-resolvase